MLYRSVVARDELAAANGDLIAALDAVRDQTWHKHPIGFRPETIDGTVHWSSKRKFWFGVFPRGSHYWIPFGTTKPTGKTALHITVEINTPRKKNHRRAGLFLRDDKGRAYIAHSGRVGGGRPHINRKEFLVFHGVKSSDVVSYDDGKLAILLGRLDSPDLLKKIGAFVAEVAAFKSDTDRPPVIHLPSQSGKPFKPKFIGKIKYTAPGQVQADLLHDLVASELYAKLQGYDCKYTVHRDLFIKEQNGATSVLYEIKTDCTTTSMYQGVGQLLLNGLGDKKAPRLVLVMPGTPDETTARVLKKIRISVLPYRWAKGKPIFPSAGQCLRP